MARGGFPGCHNRRSRYRHGYGGFTDDAVELADVIAQLRHELGRAMGDGENSSIRFRADVVELELSLAVEKARAANAGVKLGNRSKDTRSETRAAPPRAGSPPDRLPPALARTRRAPDVDRRRVRRQEDGGHGRRGASGTGAPSTPRPRGATGAPGSRNRHGTRTGPRDDDAAGNRWLDCAAVLLAKPSSSATTPDGALLAPSSFSPAAATPF
ncbi:trypco2 family protein [Actinomadura soli]|uniref:trypco2 family protein n=1 Tax=Actinomadura soli TaxID=2508997 RepID=UPI0038B2D59D